MTPQRPLLDAATDDALMRAALESSVVGVAITTAEGRFAYVNPALCQLLGYGKEELTNRRFAELTHPDDVAASLQRLAQLKSGEISGFTMRKRYLTATGETVWADLSVAAVRSTDAEQCNYVAQMVNVTAEVAAARNRADDGEELRQVAQHATDLVLVVNAAGRLTWVSDGAIAYLGRGPQELVGTGLLDLVVDASPTQAADLHELLVRGEVVRDQPTNLRHANGQVVTMRARVSPTFDRAGALTGAVIGLADDREEAATQATLSQGRSLLRERADSGDADDDEPMASVFESADAFWLEDTLRRITELAVELSDADFGAMEVPGFADDVAKLIHVGLSAEDQGLIGRLPRARGLLAIHDDTESRRIERVAEHPEHLGFPPHHPQIETILAVPVVVRGRTCAQLLLGGKRDVSFTEGDQQRVELLGAVAGIVIRNAELLHRAQHMRQLLETGNDILTSALEGGTEAELARIVVERLHALVACDTVVVMTGPHSRRPDRVLAVSPNSETLTPGAVVAVDASFSRLLATGRPARGGGALTATGPLASNIGPWVVVPAGTRGQPEVVCLALRRPGAAAFSESEEQRVVGLAARLAFALQYEELRRDSESLLLQEDRDRIARDLHDLTVQRIFAVGMMLESHLRRGECIDEALADEVVEELNGTIRELRTQILALDHEPPPLSAMEVEGAVLREAGRSMRDSSLRPTVQVDLPSRLQVDQEAVRGVVATVREGISNARRHSHPRHIEIWLDADESRFRVTVLDDGTPPPAHAPQAGPGHGRGLANLRRRAEHLGGGLEFTSTAAGNRLCWWVPVEPTSAPTREGDPAVPEA